MSGKDASVSSKKALMSTAPGKQILKQGLLKSRGYRLYAKYKDEYEREFPAFCERFTTDLLHQVSSDPDPASTQSKFADEVGSPSMALESSRIDSVRARLAEPAVMRDRVLRILDSNFVKMTLPVFSALYDAAADFDGRDASLKCDLVDGHILAIDLSEPMDRIADMDEDLEYLDDYRLMNPYILGLARQKISRCGADVLESFEAGFAEARRGQDLDVELKSKPGCITSQEMDASYAKYRAVMGTAGCNMALAKMPLGEIFYTGMARAAEGVGCGNEIEDSLARGALKVPSWPLYYSVLAGDVRKGVELAYERSTIYLREARLAASSLPEGFEYGEFLDFLFLTVEHYNRFWYDRLLAAGIWDKFASNLQRDIS